MENFLSSSVILIILTTVQARSEVPVQFENNSAHTPTGSYSFGPSDFFDCASYTRARDASLLQSTTAPKNISIAAPTLRPTITQAAALPTAMPFEDYWCSTILKQPNPDPFYDTMGYIFRNYGTMIPRFYALDASVKDRCLPFEKSEYSSWVTAKHNLTAIPQAFNDTTTTMPAMWTPKLIPPCCNTFCDVIIPSAQMLFWPTPALASMGDVTTLVGSDDFTYTSPSVYVIYHNMSATNDCGEALGGITTSLTRSFAPADLTTLTKVGVVGVTTQTINFATISSNCTTRYNASTDISPSCRTYRTTNDTDCSSQFTSAESRSLSDREHCYPQLPFPPVSILAGMDVAWANCDVGSLNSEIVGVFDPPRTLEPAPAMVSPSPTDKPDPKVMESAAAPASVVVTAMPEKTAARKVPSIMPTLDVHDPAPAAISKGERDPANSRSKTSQHPSDPPVIDVIDDRNSVDIANTDANSLPSHKPPSDLQLDRIKQALSETAHQSPPTGDKDGAAVVPPLTNEPHQELPSGSDFDRIGQRLGNPGDDRGSIRNKDEAAAFSASAPIPEIPSADLHPEEQDTDPKRGPNSLPNQAFATPVNPPTPRPFIISADDRDFSKGVVRNPSTIAIAGATITAGAPANSVQGPEISIDPGASHIVVDGASHVLPTFSAVQIADVSRVALSEFTAIVDGHSVQIASAEPSALLVDGEIVAQAASLTIISNTPIAFLSDGDLIIGSSPLRNITSDPTEVAARTQQNTSPARSESKDMPTNVFVSSSGPDGIVVAGATTRSRASSVLVSGTEVIFTSTSFLERPSSTQGIRATLTTAMPGENDMRSTGNKNGAGRAIVRWESFIIVIVIATIL